MADTLFPAEGLTRVPEQIQWKLRHKVDRMYSTMPSGAYISTEGFVLSKEDKIEECKAFIRIIIDMYSLNLRSMILPNWEPNENYETVLIELLNHDDVAVYFVEHIISMAKVRYPHLRKHEVVTTQSEPEEA